MHNINSVFFFIFVFALLVTLRNLLNFVSALSQKKPEKYVLSDRELIILGFSLSYILTYITFQ